VDLLQALQYGRPSRLIHRIPQGRQHHIRLVRQTALNPTPLRGQENASRPAISGMGFPPDKAASLQQSQNRSDGVRVRSRAFNKGNLRYTLLLGQHRQGHELIRGNAGFDDPSIRPAVKGQIRLPQEHRQFVSSVHVATRSVLKRVEGSRVICKTARAFALYFEKRAKWLLSLLATRCPNS
jgi:hypothetical protein